MLSLYILLVLVILTAIAGFIYAFLYYTRINPRGPRSRTFKDTSSGNDDGEKTQRTHIFMFK